ncbi:hypothetical protein ACIQWS_00720 [Phyllobacterium sp. NPDC097923]|uniref:hypothetical protein n=1 Tax=Phyllobacterium sp. NPDC097923 TaxID=3364404 RepID=UPI00383A81C4
MIGLFLPRLRVVFMLHAQLPRPASGLNRLTPPVARPCRNNEQDGSGHVSTRI